MKLALIWSHDDLRNLGIGVLVEGWSRKDNGSFKRKYNAEFSEEERRKIREFYNKAYGWIMRTGIPDEHRMSMADYNLIQRAVNFWVQNS